MERGRWYIIEFKRRDGLLRVLGPNAVATPIHENFVRIVNEEPKLITRIQATRGRPLRSSEGPQMLEFYGMCPKGHRIDGTGLGGSQAHCPDCGRDYGVEDEAHISEVS